MHTDTCRRHSDPKKADRLSHFETRLALETPPNHIMSSISVVVVNDPEYGILLNSCAISKDGKFAVFGSGDAAIAYCYDVQKKRFIHECNHGYGFVEDVAISSDGSVGVYGALDSMGVFSVKDNNCDYAIPLFDVKDAFQRPYVSSVAISHDGSIALGGDSENTVMVANLVGDFHPYKLNTFAAADETDNEIKDLAISKDGRVAVGASDDKYLYVWNLESKDPEPTLAIEYANPVQHVAISSDGKTLLSHEQESSFIHVYSLNDDNTDVVTERLIDTDHSDDINGFAITDDASMLVTCSEDKTIKVWNVTNGTCLEVKEFDRPIYTLSISSYGTTIIAVPRTDDRSPF